MKTALIALTTLCAVFFAGAVHAQQKPGLWEARTLKMAVDGKDMLPQMRAAQEQMRQSLAQMPPEQRKQMEAMMPAQSDPTVQRLCVTPEMAKSDQGVVPRQSGCSEPKVSRSGNRATFEVTCKQGANTTVSKGESVTTGDQVTSKFETVSTGGGRKQVMMTEMQMSFLGSDCGSVKPLDQMSKDAGAGAKK
ncbi:MAG: DUF3617 domain-containing protein [Betaproteobacteria bacterium]|nr:DUF3617 domain-containing protein [Betaproteobacteria bacterium]MCL2885259.1 DUF3617 domain-containing protein [Betaproteobacteria bacterium]